MNMPKPYRYLEVGTLERNGRPLQNILLIDARSPEEYSAGHVPGAINIPLDDLSAYVAENSDQMNEKIVTMCGSSGRGEKAADALLDLGLLDINILRGGLKAWKEAGYPVE